MVDTETKVCTMCKEVKSIFLFRNRGGSLKHLLKSRCNTCLHKEHRRWIEENPERVKEYKLKDSWTLVKRCSRRGITPKELIEKYEQQKECCAICKSHIEIVDSAIDHNHLTEEFRGVLCKICNRGLGFFKDNISILENAVEYLKINGTYGNKN